MKVNCGVLTQGTKENTVKDHAEITCTLQSIEVMVTHSMLLEQNYIESVLSMRNYLSGSSRFRRDFEEWKRKLNISAALCQKLKL